MELKLYLRMLLRSWWIVALTALAAVTAALVNAYLATPQYSTQARFLITPSKLLNAADFTRLLEGGNFVPTFAEIWNSNSAFDSTGQALQMDPSDLNDYSRSAVIAPSAQVIELTVTGPNPVQSALIANTLGAFAMAETNDNFGNVVAISVLDAAQAPRADRPISPQPARDAGLALALGLVIGSVLAIGREQLRIPLEALRRFTTTDSESSAFNHSYFRRSLEDELTHNRAGQVSLGLVQLSGLTDLYENMPPLVKQRLMQYVTKTLQKELRGSDSVGRWTDTSFGVLLPATPAQPATRTLERIQRALTRPVEIDKGDRLDLAPYVGVAVVSGEESAATLIAQAEAALTQAHHTGQSLMLYTEGERAPYQAPAQAEPIRAAIVPEPAAVETNDDEGLLANAATAVEVREFEPEQPEAVMEAEAARAEIEPTQLETTEADRVTDGEVAEIEIADSEVAKVEIAEDEVVEGQVEELEPVQLNTSEVEPADGHWPEAEVERVVEAGAESDGVEVEVIEGEVEALEPVRLSITDPDEAEAPAKKDEVTS